MYVYYRVTSNQLRYFKAENYIQIIQICVDLETLLRKNFLMNFDIAAKAFCVLNTFFITYKFGCTSYVKDILNHFTYMHMS